MLLRIPWIVWILMLGACASSTPKKDVLTVGSIEGKLAEIVTHAQEQGPVAVKFIASDLFIKATDASLNGNSETAAFIYKYVVQLNPTDRYLQKKYAVELVKVNQLTPAITIFEKILSVKESDYLELCMVLGELYSILGKNDSAQNMYAKILAANKSVEENYFEDACISLVKLYGAEKKYSLAHATLNRCAGRLPRSAVLAYYQGKIQVNEQKLAEAKTSFQLAVKRDPDLVQAVIALGVLLEQEEKIESASIVYQHYLDRGNMNEVVLAQQVNALDALGKWEQLVPLLEEYVKIDATNVNVRAKLGVLYHGQKKYQQALAIFLALEKEVPGSDKILYYLGVISSDLMEWSAAITYFEKIPTESPLYPESILQITQIWGRMAREEEILEGPIFQKMQSFINLQKERMPELKLDLAIELALYYEEKNAMAQAIATLTPFMEHDLRSKVTDNQLYYYATLLDKIGQKGQAREVAEVIVQRNPNSAEALNFVGYSLVEEGIELSKAYNYLLRAMKLMPEDGHIRDSLAWYFYRIGDYQRALKELKRAQRAVADEPVIYRHIVIVYRELKLYDKAQEFLAEALKKCDREEDRQELQQLQGGLGGAVRIPASR